jgi:GNAT superfamily N-acetyltransferase
MTDPDWSNAGFIWCRTRVPPRTPAWKCVSYYNGVYTAEGCIVYRRDHIWIQYIQTTPSQRRLGYATELMEQIINHPPRKKRYIRLIILAFDENPDRPNTAELSMQRDQLRAFYSKLGFVGTRKRQMGYQVWELDTRKRVNPITS